MTKLYKDISKEDVILVIEQIEKNKSNDPVSVEMNQFNEALLFYLKGENADKKCGNCIHCDRWMRGGKSIYKCNKVRGKYSASEDEYEDYMGIKKNQQACNFYE
jgi:hypothetical protein